MSRIRRQLPAWDQVINDFEVEIWVEEIGEDITFTGTAKYQGGSRQTLEDDGEPEGWFCEEVGYDESDYSGEQCQWIDKHLGEAASMISKKAEIENRV